MSIRVIELFAGVGGFRRGLESASNKYKFVWANQWEPSRKTQDAYNCYCDHFGYENHSNENIHDVVKKNLPEHDLLVGGFPCQDYSVASTGAKGIQGKKGVLWWDIYSIVESKNPKYVLLENVDRLLKSPSSQRGRDFAIILACFKQQGYSVEWRVINAADYGFPQRRRRVFIFAYRNDTAFANKIENCDSENLLNESGFFQSIFPTTKKNSNKHLPNTFEFKFDDLVDVSEHFQMKFYNSGIMTNDSIHTEELVANSSNKKLLLSDIIQTNVDEKFYLGENLEKWEYMKGSKRIERTHKDGHKYVFSEGKIAFPDPIDRPARTMLTSEASRNRSTHVILDPQTNRLRTLTPVECEKLNGFPADWTKTGMSDRFRYFCMGNALVVDLVKIMGEKIAKL